MYRNESTELLEVLSWLEKDDLMRDGEREKRKSSGRESQAPRVIYRSLAAASSFDG